MNWPKKRFNAHDFKWTFYSLKSIKITKDLLKRNNIVNRLNHTNSKLKGVGLLSSDVRGIYWKLYTKIYWKLGKLFKYFCVFRIFFTLKLTKTLAVCFNTKCVLMFFGVVRLLLCVFKTINPKKDLKFYDLKCKRTQRGTAFNYGCKLDEISFLNTLFA